MTIKQYHLQKYTLKWKNQGICESNSSKSESSDLSFKKGREARIHPCFLNLEGSRESSRPFPLTLFYYKYKTDF